MSDPVGETIIAGGQAILKQLAALDVWDLAPMVYLMTRSLVDSDELPDRVVARAPDAVREAIEDRPHDVMGMRFGFRAVPVPDELWDLTDPATVLRGFARVVRDDPRTRLLFGISGLDGRLIGLLLVVEAWTIRADAWPSPFAPGSLATHPDRAEMRAVFAVDTADVAYTLVQVRGEDGIDVSRTPVFDWRIEASIPEALAEVLAVLADDPDVETLR